MKRLYLVIPFILILLVIPLFTASAAGEGDMPADAGVLCLPGIYMSNPGNCASTGPSTYLTSMAENGFTFPEAPLPVSRPDRALTQINTGYGMVNKRNAPVYGSLEAAVKNKKGEAIRTIDASFSYISYIDEQYVDGKRFYQVEYGEWMTANDIIRLGSVPLFQGVQLSRTPKNAFGWVLSYLSPGPVETKRTPGYQNQNYTGHVLNNQDLVQVYGVEKVGEDEWYMVGPDEWLPDRVVARVLPNTTPPQGVPGDRWIEVNLYEQTLAVYDQGELVFATLIASGLEPFWTRPGLFQIYRMLDSGPMSGSFEADRSDAYYLEDVPWTMYYDDARALHGAYWRANLGFPQSHGCVNLTVGDSRWIFDWAQEGDWVYVWDPSGKTPVDPNAYTQGGA